MQYATRESWPTKPMPEAKAQLEMDAVLENEAYAKIQAGYVPQGPQDKWFLFVEEDRLFVHRSVSGSCIYVAEFEPVAEGVAITAAWANRDPQQYKNEDPIYDARLLVYLIRKLLLEHEVPFPLPSDLPHQNSQIHQRHVMGDKGSNGSSFIPLNLI